MPLGSKSHGLLLFGGEVEVFGHFVDERVDFVISEFEYSEGIDPVFDRRGEEDSFVGEVLTNLCELVL